MTEKIFYVNPEKYREEAKILDLKEEGDLIGILLDRSIFYPEGGGQKEDKGVIKGEEFELEVFKVIEIGEDIWHYGKIKGKIPKKEEVVLLEIDKNLRREYCQQHSAQHLFSAILEKKYGYETTGFQILEDHTKIEIPLSSDINLSYIKLAEEETNKVILEGVPIKTYWEDENKRIVEIIGYDINPCGGLHVKNTREIGLFKVLKVYRKNSQFWRIEFIAGDRILKRLEKREKEYEEIKQKLGDPEIVEAVEKLLEKLREKEKENKKLKEEVLEYRIKEIIEKAIETPFGKVILEKFDEDINTLKFLAQKISEISFSLLFNDLNQLVIIRNKTFSEEIWKEILILLKESNFKGGISDYFIQGKLEEKDKFIRSLKHLLFKN